MAGDGRPHEFQEGLRIPLLPNFKYFPVSNSMRTDCGEPVASLATPAALEKNTRAQNCRPPPETTDSSSVAKIHHNLEQNYQFFTSQHVVTSSKEMPLQQAEEENQVVDLRKAPKQKPKRKKHRPKVVREDKRPKTPKPVTPKSVTPPRAARTEHTPEGKRKYVRKKKDHDSPQKLMNALGEFANPNVGKGKRSVRRALKYDLTDSQARDGCSTSEMLSTHNAESNVTTVSPFTNSDAHIFRRPDTNLLNPLDERIMLDLNCSPNQSKGEDLEETLNRIEANYMSMLNNLISPQKPGRSEEKSLKKLARKNSRPNIASDVERSLESDEVLAASDKISDLRLQGTKRGHGLLYDAQVSTGINLMHAQNGMDNGIENHDTSRSGMCFPEIYKKKRTDGGDSEGKSPYSTFTCTSTGWKMTHYQNTSEVFTFADAQWFRANEKLQDERTTNCRPYLGHSPLPPAIIIQNEIPTPIMLGHNNVGCLETSRPEKLPTSNDNQDSMSCGPNARIEALIKSKEMKLKNRRHRKKENIHLLDPTYSNAIQTENEAPSCRVDSSHRLKSINMIASDTRDYHRKTPYHQKDSVQDSQATCYERSVSHGFQMQISRPYAEPIDEIIQKLRTLKISRVYWNSTTAQLNALVPYAQQNALVPYAQQNALVPYAREPGPVVPFSLVKKRKPRAKVDLDPESDRVWNVLMGKQIDDEESTADKEKWWEDERRIFRGRVDSFISRMHLIQGDRRFSRWKGSVVDSVIGVFLTQNVSDHLSSSAFISLAARFPVKSRGVNETKSAEKTSNPMAFDTSTGEQVKLSEQGSGSLSSAVIHESGQVDQKEMLNSKESFGSNAESGIIDYLKGNSMECNEKELQVSHASHDTGSPTELNVTCCTNKVEGDDRRPIEDIVSSPNSVVSSQNSSEYPVQDADQGKGNSMFSIDANDFRPNGANSFTELLMMANSGVMQELNTHGIDGIHQLRNLSNNQKSSSIINQSDFLSDEGISTYTSNYTSNSCRKTMSKQSLPNSSLVELAGVGSQNDLFPASYEINRSDEVEIVDKQCGTSTEHSCKGIDQNMPLDTGAPLADTCVPINQNLLQPVTSTGPEAISEMHSFCQSTIAKETCVASSEKSSFSISSHSRDEKTAVFQQREIKTTFQMETTNSAVKPQNENRTEFSNNKNSYEGIGSVGSHLRSEENMSQKNSDGVSKTGLKHKILKDIEFGKKSTLHWDSLRRQTFCNGVPIERSSDTMDSMDYEALRNADVNEISNAIRERGMNNLLAARMKGLLNRLVEDHGSIDMEWLRDAPPGQVKDYLLSIRGLGLKSVECVRLLTLHHLAFPVDTNVGRIAVRLGWVPLQNLPDSLQLHLLELYPVMETIQKYLWPRLCKLDQHTLYELHYQMITFGKVFCTKSKPNCNACPMKGECKHFASAFASARLLTGPEEKSSTSSMVPTAIEGSHTPVSKTIPQPQLEVTAHSQDQTVPRNNDPIIEEPPSPEPECQQTLESEIEDAFFYDPDEIPTINLNMEEFTQNLHDYMKQNMDLPDGEISNALVALTSEAASIPMPKLKNVSRLRTEHQVYEIPDAHPLLEGMDERELDDPSPYLLAIWAAGETAQSFEPPKACCDSRDTTKLCEDNTCFSCNTKREAQAQTVRGTLLIPCRTAMKGSFPLNGTYFQVNEVFADHDSSRNPINVPRNWIWNLPRRTVYFGTSIPSIFKGLTTEAVQHCFWRGFVCVRGFDRTSRAPRPLYARLHFPVSKMPRDKKAATAAKEVNKS